MKKIKFWACTSLSALFVLVAVGGGAQVCCPIAFYQPEPPRK
jgi:cyclic lactone autoinducer peptide